MKAAEAPSRVALRKRWTVRGQVQGVGFRPFVYRLAGELGLSGYVRNDSSCVTIEIQGSAEAVARFGERLVSERPQLARYDEIAASDVPPTWGEAAFQIVSSQADVEHRPVVTVDTAVCSDCLRELFEPADFRHGYGLINCTNCGPRYSIIRAMPYDRANTTMAQFPLCEKCHQQYTDPADRRFHAQPVACPECGPKVEIFDFRLSSSDLDEPIRKAAELLIEGKIVAIKGIGGFHLACRADSSDAVGELRRRKHRDAKPFALMVCNVATARELVQLSPEAERELTSPSAPIILAVRSHKSKIENRVAPGTDRLGLMLPYTPIQHLLFAALAGKVDVLVMTSANVSDEPLVKDNEEAKVRLAGLADAILWHNRDIERCVDDSILLDLGTGQKPLPIRRARGYVPQPISISFDRKSKIENRKSHGLCVGGELKNTVAVVRGSDVVLSQHLGDLKHTLGFEYFKKAIEDLCRLMEVRPEWIAHDLHPAYLSTQWAKELAAKWNVPLIGVQHHHAHAAAVLAEHGITEPALAVVCDGVGYGLDGTAWGGELLVVAPQGTFERIGHLHPMLLPGGDAAARDTRRCAAGLLWSMDRQEQVGQLFDSPFERDMVLGMLRSGSGCVTSSAAGRLFDAVASILGVCQRNDHEAQAPMALEALANCASGKHAPGHRFTISNDKTLGIDLRPVVDDLIGQANAGEDPAELAALFHEQFTRAWASAVSIASQCTHIETVALSGGVFCNARLTTRLTELLSKRGLRVVRHEIVPPNDGGIAFGQAAVAMARKEQVQCV